jgi:hypothetical protein
MNVIEISEPVRMDRMAIAVLCILDGSTKNWTKILVEILTPLLLGIDLYNNLLSLNRRPLL